MNWIMTKLAVNKFLGESLINTNSSIGEKTYSVIDMVTKADFFVQIIMAIYNLRRLANYYYH